MRNKITTSILIAIAFFAAINTFLGSQEVYAAKFTDEIIYNQIEDCYSKSSLKYGPVFTKKLNDPQEFKKYDQILYPEAKTYTTMVPSGSLSPFGSKIVYTKEAQEKGIDCETMLKQYLITGKKPPDNENEKEKLLTRIGYDSEALSKEVGCITITFKGKIEAGASSNFSGIPLNGEVGKICWAMDDLQSDKLMSDANASSKKFGTSSFDIAQDGWGHGSGKNNVAIWFWNKNMQSVHSGGQAGEYLVWDAGVVSGNSHDGGQYPDYTGNGLMTIRIIEYDFNIKKIDTIVNQSVAEVLYSSNGGNNLIRYNFYANFSKEQDDNLTESAKKFTLKLNSEAYATARETLSGSREKYSVTNEDKKNLYSWYLNNIFDLIPSDMENCLDEKPENPISDEGGIYVKTGCKWCKVQYGGNDRYVTAFSPSETKKLNQVVSGEELLQLLNGLYEDEEFDSEDCGIDFGRDFGGSTVDPNNPGDDLDGNGDSEASDLQRCMKMSNSLGWIICPVIQVLNDAVQGIYSRVESDFLIVQSSFFENDNVKEIWQSVLGFADTLLVVVIVVIVFSQLTGVGIDNYGIKRMLPKVIVVAVLVNISFLICQLAVEVSNIIGTSVNDMLSVGISVAPGGMADEKGALLFGTLLTAISGGLIGGVVASVVTGGWFAILIPLLVALVTSLVAVFFFFVMLGIRKAAIIVLVLVSPLAMICYALPNTKSIFDKWLKYFKSLLLLFPICGAMMGGGQLMAKLLMSVSTDYFMAFTGLMLMVVPFFFIPKFLRGALDAIGGIGAAVGNMSRRIGGGAARATGKLEKSDYVQDRMDNYAGERARRISDSLKYRRNKTPAQSRRLARYNKKANEWELSNSAGHLDSIVAAQDKAMADQRVKDESARINTELNVNDVGELGREYSRSLASLMTDPSDADALATTKALQDIMVGTEAGRNEMSRVMKSAARNNTDGQSRQGLQKAASHLATEHGGTLKGANRGTFNMANQMASGEWNKVSSALPAVSSADHYSYAGSEKYTAESFAKADDAAIKGMAKEYDRIVNQVVNNNYTPTSSEQAFMNNMENIVYDINNSSNVKLSSNVKGFIQNIPAIKH